MNKIRDLFLANSQLKQYGTLIDDLPEICKRDEVFTINKLSMDSIGELYKTISRRICISLANQKDIYKQLADTDNRPKLEDNFANPTVNIDLNIDIYELEDDKIQNNQTFLKKSAITLPVYTVDGMFINGQQYKFMTTLEAEKGIQIKKSTDNEKGNGETYKSLVVVFRPMRGTEITIKETRKGFVSKYIIKTKRAGVSNSTELIIMDLLRAYSGYDLDMVLADIESEIGICHTYPAFEDNVSKSIDECRAIALSALIPYQDGINYVDIENTFRNNIAKGKYFCLSNSAKENARRLFSYSTRCHNCILAEDVLIGKDDNKVELKAGTVLTSEILNLLDESNVKAIYIEFNNSKLRITNYPISDYLDYNYLVNLTNIIEAEISGFNIMVDIDSLQSKKCYCSYTFLKEFLDLKIDQMMEEIISNIKHLPDDERLVINFNPEDYNFINYYKTLQQYGNVACVQPVVGRNTLSDSNGDYKVTSAIKEPTLDARAVRLENAFFLDSQASPESEKAGITQHLSCTAFVDKNGHLSNYFLKVKEGTVTNEQVILTSTQAFYEHICPTPIKNPDDIVEALYKNNVVQCSAKQITYVPMIPMSISSPAISIGVGTNSNKGRRAQMAGNHAEQYIPVLGAERHLVTTGMPSFIEGKIIRCSEILSKICILNGVQKAKVDGIRLIENSTLPNTACYTFAALDTDLKYPAVIKVDYLKTIMQMVQSYELNISLRNEPIWYGDEIVLHPMDIDAKPTEVIMPEDLVPDWDTDGFGYLDRDEIRQSISEKDLAMGVNLLVGFLSWHGYCYEDGILIRQGLVDSMKYSNVFTHVVEYELSENESVSYMEGSNYKLGSNGYPIVNTYYADEEVLLTVINTKQNFMSAVSTEDQRKVQPKFIRVPHGYGGFVQSCEQFKKDKKTVIRITMGGIKNLEQGDKFTGHHGNKGVITKILPDSEMPCLADGTPLDMCVNPLGVPSRMNIGQLIEVALGINDKSKVIVASPYSDTMKLYGELQKSNLFKDNLVTVYDNETLRPLPNKVNVGYMYIMKLDHSVSKKLNFIADAGHVDSKTGQPRKASLSPGGQSLSEYALNALIANGAYKTVDYFYSTGSDDRIALRKMISEMKSKGKAESKGTNDTYNLALAYLRTVGLNISNNTMNGLQVSLLTDGEIGEIANKLDLASDSSDILYYNEFSKVKTKTGKIKESKKQYTYVDCGNIAWVNPAVLNYTLSKIIKVNYISPAGEEKFKNLSSYIVKGIINSKFYIKIEEQDDYKSIIVRDAASVEFLRDADEYLTGGIAFLYIMNNITKQDIIKSIENNKKTKDEEDTDDVNEDEDLTTETDEMSMLDNLKNYDDVTLCGILECFTDFKDLITNKLLLMPLGYRPVSRTRGIEDSMNKILYKAVIYLQNMSNPGVDLKNDTEGAKKVNLRFMSAYNNFYKYWYTICVKSDISEYFDKRNTVKSPWLLLKAKEAGIIRNGLLKKRINFSGRSTIVGVPELRIDEAYLPKIGVYETYKYLIINWMRESEELQLFSSYFSNDALLEIINFYRVGELSGLCNAIGGYLAISNKKKQEEKKPYFDDLVKLKDANMNAAYLSSYEVIRRIGQLLDIVVKRNIYNERIILVREPALHRQNTQAFKIKVWDSKTIGVNTLICSSYNADFDGDQMAAFAALPDVCKAECDEKLSPKNLLTEDRTGGNNYSLKQDCVLGFYTATNTEYNNADEAITYNGLKALARDVDSRKIDLRTKVYLLNEDLTTTAGRAYVANTLTNYLPILKGTVKDSTKYLILNSKNLDKLIMDSLVNMEPEDFIIFLNNMKLLGFHLQDLNNTSLSLSDFVDLANKQAVYNKLSQRDYLKILNFKALCGFYQDKTAKSRELDDRFNREAIDILKAQLNKDSNLYRIFNSGARGGFGNLSEPLIHGGYIKDLRDNLVPANINGNLLNGFNPLEVYLSGFEVRRAQLSTTLSTKNAGVMTRTLIFVANDECITETDCGAKPVEHEIYFKPAKKTEEDFFATCMEKVLTEDSEGFNLVGTRKMDKGCYISLIEHGCTHLKFTDGTSFEIEYEVDPLTYSHYVNRLGYKLGDNSKEVILTKDLINAYIKAGYKTIYARTLFECKCHTGICAHCYGADIHKENKEKYLPINQAIGVTAAQVIGEILSQMTMDVKNASSEQNTTTNVVERVIQIITLTKSENKKINAHWIETSSPVRIENMGNYVKVSYARKEFIVLKSRVLVGDGMIIPKGTKIIDGENVYGKLLQLLPFNTVRTLIFKEITDIISNLGTTIDVRYVEILIHAMSRNSVIKESIPEKGLVAGSFLDTNIAQQYKDDFGLKTEQTFTNYVESNISRGIIKALCGQDPQTEISLSLMYNNRDFGQSMYSKIFLGIPLGASKNVFEIAQPKTKVKQTDNVKEEKVIKNNTEIIETTEFVNNEEIDLSSFMQPAQENKNSSLTNFFS